MLGTLVNALAIIAGGSIGLLLRRGLSRTLNELLMQAVGLAVVLIGVKGALQSDQLLLIIISMVLGAITGELIKIETRIESLARWMGRFLAQSDTGWGQGFVTASLAFCVGSMAVVGSLESGLTGQHQTLYAKSVLDGVMSIIFASTLGVGTLFSAGAVLVYQGLWTVSAGVIKPLLSPEVIQQMGAVGGILIFAIGLNVMKISVVRVGNMLPAIVMPLIFDAGRHLAGRLLPPGLF